MAADGTAYVGNFGFDDRAGESFAQATRAIVSADGSAPEDPAQGRIETVRVDIPAVGLP